MTDRVAGSPASNVALAQSATRPTPTPVRPSVSFGAVLSSTTKPLSAVMNALPGSSLIAVAVRSGPQVTLSEGGTSAGTLGGVSTGGGVTATGPGAGGVGTGGSVSTGDVAGATGDMMAQQQQLMMEQMAISSATETFNTQSNIEAAGHQARMNAISNMRG